MYRYKKSRITSGLLFAHDNPSHPSFNSPCVYQILPLHIPPSTVLVCTKDSPFTYLLQQSLCVPKTPPSHTSFNSPCVYQRLPLHIPPSTVLVCTKDSPFTYRLQQSLCVPKTTERFVTSLHTMHYRYILLCNFMKIGATLATLFSLSNLSKHQPYSHAITFSIVTK